MIDVAKLTGDLSPNFDLLRKCNSCSAVAEWLVEHEDELYVNIADYGEVPSLKLAQVIRPRFVRAYESWVTTLALTLSESQKHFFTPGRRRSPYHLLRGTGIINHWDLSRPDREDHSGFWTGLDNRDGTMAIQMRVAFHKDLWTPLHIGQKLLD